MKRALLLHGTDGTPEGIWFPWLKELLEMSGYGVWVPLLPGNHTPNAKVYNDFLFGSDWDFSDNLVIGHSSGAVSVLNMLMDARCPKVDTAVLVGAWASMDEAGALDKEQFKDLFPPAGFDFDIIRSRVHEIAFLHGDDDPYCPLDQAQWLAEQLQAPITIVPNGHHLGGKYGTELPPLEVLLRQHRLL